VVRGGSLLEAFRSMPPASVVLLQYPVGDVCLHKDPILVVVRMISKVTSKLQLTVPKRIADQYGIRPGDELQWTPAGESIRVSLAGSRTKAEHPLTLSQGSNCLIKAANALTRCRENN
jgi:AbrB family looped-hinge helix DNA binding protein